MNTHNLFRFHVHLQAAKTHSIVLTVVFIRTDVPSSQYTSAFPQRHDPEVTRGDPSSVGSPLQKWVNLMNAASCFSEARRRGDMLLSFLLIEAPLLALF